jgi:hypothetical protein
MRETAARVRENVVSLERGRCRLVFATLRAAAAIVCGFAGGTSSVFGYALSGPRWTSTPVSIRLQLGASPVLIDGSASWDASAESALAAWNSNTSGVNLSPSRDPAAPKGNGNNINNVFFSSEIYGSAWGSGVLAVTLSRYSGSSMRECDVLFNSLLSWNSYSGPLRAAPGGGTMFDFYRVALHEFGHVLGLNHPDQFGQNVVAIMNSHISNLDALATDDVNGLHALYGGGSTAQPPTITSQPSSQTVTEGQPASFAVGASSSLPVSYQWMHNNAPVAGATGATLSFPSVTSADAGSYFVVVSNSAGSTLSTTVTLTVLPPITISPPTITAQPGSQTVNAGANVNFIVVAQGDPPLIYQWRKNGSAIPGATSATLALNAVVAADAGDYDVVVSNDGGGVLSTVARLTVNTAPVILTSPGSISITQGTAFTLTVAATGSPAPAYQWRKDGIAIAGATNSSYTVAAAQLSDAGSYTVVVSNVVGSVTSAPAVVAVVVPPSIVTQPTDKVVVAGHALTLSVVATGTPAPAYQWRRNGATVAGATSATFAIANAQPADAGGYTVRVSNLAGVVESVTANVTVLVPPLITTQPASISVAGGDSFTLSTAATGTPPPTFQWRRNGIDLPGANGPTLNVTAAQPDDAGNYSVVVTNAAGSTTSATVAVIVNVGRLINLSARGYIAPGGSLTTGFVVRGGDGKQLLVRAIGPTLATFQIAGALAQTQLELNQDGAATPVAANADWAGTTALRNLFDRVGAFPLPVDSHDSALEATALPAGNFTARVTSANAAASGIALAEIYDADLSLSPTRLANVSTLGFTGNGEQALAMGFVIGGNTPKNVLIRAIGPTLATYHVPDRLADPRVHVTLAGESASVGDNDDWGGTVALSNAFDRVGAFAMPVDSKDAALVLSLAPGNYSVVVSGAAGGVGNVLLEIYDLDP